jgi:hypothetical protein
MVEVVHGTWVEFCALTRAADRVRATIEAFILIIGKGSFEESFKNY